MGDEHLHSHDTPKKKVVVEKVELEEVKCGSLMEGVSMEQKTNGRMSE